MTYQEVKDRLSKCELTLEKLKNGSYKAPKNINVKETAKQLELLRESLQKQLTEMDKGVIYTDDEQKAKELSDKGSNVKLTKEMKPGSPEAAEHERFKRLSPKDQETIKKIQALMQAEKDAQNEAEEDAIEHHDMAGQEPPVDDHDDLDVGHQDDEPNMLKKDIYDIATYAAKLYKQLNKYDQFDGEVDFPHWWQKKVTLAREYMSSAQHYLEAEEKQPALDQLALEESVDETMSSEQNEAIMDLQNILDQAAQLGDEARQIFKQHFPSMLSKGDAYGAFELGQSANRYDTTLESLIDEIQEHGDELDEARSVNKVKAEYDELVGKMKELAKHYKTAEGDKKDKIVKALLQHTDRKKELAAELDKAVAGTNRNQELNERGDSYLRALKSVIQDMASDFDGDEVGAAEEAMEAIGQEYGIDFEFGAGPSRQVDELFGSNVNYDEIIGGIIKRFHELKKYVSKKEPDAMEDLQKVLRAFEIFDEKMAYGAHMELEQVNEEKATCCGKCGRVHVKGTKCKTPYLKGADHCRNN